MGGGEGDMGGISAFGFSFVSLREKSPEDRYKQAKAEYNLACRIRFEKQTILYRYTYIPIYRYTDIPIPIYQY